MEKKQIQKFGGQFSKFEKNELNELATIQGGLAAGTFTSGDGTSSSSDDPDSNGTDSDKADKDPIIIIIMW